MASRLRPGARDPGLGSHMPQAPRLGRAGTERRPMTWLRYVGGMLGLAAAAASTATAQKTPPRFEDYPARQIVRTPGNRVDLSKPDSREFRTMLREFSKDTPDFAGHYVVATWGCGSPCQTVALIDALTGKVYWLPTVTSRGSEYRLDSRLLVADPPSADSTWYEVASYTYFYEWTGTHFRLIDSLPVASLPPAPDSLVR